MSLCVSIAVVCASGISLCIPAEPASTQGVTGFTSSESAVQELDARLWRTEFLGTDGLLTSRSTRSEQSTALNSHESQVHPDQSRSTGIPAKSVPLFLSLQEPMPAIHALMQFSDDPAFSGNVAVGGQRSISDWEKAAAFPARNGEQSATVSGPSLTTYLVAFVAAVVLLGTILSPK